MKAFFLDRDGVINIDHGYVSSSEQFDFNPDVFEACRMIKASGFHIFIVTNQSGIGRGLFSEQDFAELNRWMLSQFRTENVMIDNVYYCPHHATYGQGQFKLDCQCRKPKPGMLLKAQQAFGIDMASSVMVGDRLSDMQAGLNAGVGNLYLIGNNGGSSQVSYDFTRVDSLISAVKAHINTQ